MTDLAAKPRQQVFLDLLFHALRVKDARLNEHAAEVFRRLDTDTVRRLVLEAAHKRNSSAHRLRVLAVIEGVGQLSGVDDWLDLNVIAADKNPQIRHAAARCLVRHGASGSQVTPASPSDTGTGA